jgi:Zn-finger nucleic acid-binding protein
MAEDAGTLHCPNCGSPAKPEDTHCGYCHAELATVSCPSCFALLFRGSAYCPHCGARAARVPGSDRRLPCPGCVAKMHEITLGATTLFECEKCAGLWVDNETFQHICADNDTRAAVLTRWPALTKAAAAPPVRYRPCAVCRKMMNRLNFGRMSGTVIDICSGHGIFLDAGELHEIVTFIQNGGLDRARERQIEDLKEAEERLRAAERDQTRRTVRTGEASGVRVEWHTTRLEGADALEALRRLLRENKS